MMTLMLVIPLAGAGGAAWYYAMWLGFRLGRWSGMKQGYEQGASDCAKYGHVGALQQWRQFVEAREEHQPELRRVGR